jgi:hypothetical protein
VVFYNRLPKQLPTWLAPCLNTPAREDKKKRKKKLKINKKKWDYDL